MSQAFIRRSHNQAVIAEIFLFIIKACFLQLNSFYQITLVYVIPVGGGTV